MTSGAVVGLAVVIGVGAFLLGFILAALLGGNHQCR